MIVSQEKPSDPLPVLSRPARSAGPLSQGASWAMRIHARRVIATTRLAWYPVTLTAPPGATAPRQPGAVDQRAVDQP